MRRLCLALPLVVIIFATTARPTRAQSRAQTPATYRIAGTVVSELDQHPLQRATIKIFDPTQQQTIQSTTSDEYGHFAFTGVPAGLYTLQGTAPGYLPTTYDEHTGFNTGIVTGAGVDTESLVLKLRREATIAGTIHNESFEPIEHAAVRLFRQTHDFGDSRMVSAGMLNTDDLGHFEDAQILPGTYFLAAIATPWYAVHPAPETQSRLPAFGFADSIDPTLDVAYPITYYPDTTDPARAAAIVVRGGETRELDLQITAQPAVTLTISRAPVTPGNGQPPDYPQLRTSIFGDAETIMSGETRPTPTQFIVTGLAPGDYLLSDQRNNGSQSDDGTPLHLSERTAAATFPSASDLVHVKLRLKSADGSPMPTSLWVGLVRRNAQKFVSGQVSAKGEATLDAAPGDYYFSIEGSPHTYFIRQIVSNPDSNPDSKTNAQRLPSRNIHLSAGDSPSLTITFVGGTHTLKGVIRKDGKPCPGAFILLVPSDEIHEVHTAYRQQSDLDGTFDIAGLASGAYTLIAIDGGWDLDWAHDAVLSRYLPNAVTVQIPDSAAKVQNLPTPVAVQNR
jgi:hypothetical protein